MASPSIVRIIKAVNKAVGSASVRAVGAIEPLKTLSTRCATIDAATGIGGIPYSRLSIIAGMESTGKTTAALHCCAEVQGEGGVAMFLDHEHKLDLAYARDIGVNIDDLILGPPEGNGYLERSLDIMYRTIQQVEKNPVPTIIVLDSINAAKPKAVMDKAFEEGVTVAAQARVMSDSIPRLIELIDSVPVALLWISQPRQNIGGHGRNLVAGGNAPKFYASLIFKLYHTGFYKVDGRNVGSNMEAQVVKSSVGVPFKKAPYRIIWGEGIDFNGAVCERAVQLGLMNIGTSGWHEFAIERSGETTETIKWQGRSGLDKKLKKVPDLIEQIQKAIRAKEARLRA
jgi:recombination protein RecA